MPHPPVYLDHHATTPCHERVVEAMLPYFGQRFGNPASTKHAHGRTAAQAVQRARIQIARLMSTSPKEIVFTSGATESLNLALKGLFAMHPQRRHLITLPTEHRAVLQVAQKLARSGVETTLVEVDSAGQVALEALEAAIRPDTLAIAVMAANNEMGAIYPVAKIGALCAEHGLFFICDATQAAGKIPFDFRGDGVHLAALSAHKMYGPKGIGALLVRGRAPRVRLRSQIDGGTAENGLRAGTLNVPGIVGLGEACELASGDMEAQAERQRGLRDSLLAQLNGGISDLRLNGTLERRLPNNLNVSVPGVPGDALLDALRPDLAVSSGSACSTGTTDASHVLRAIGVSEALAFASIRFGLGRSTTAEDIALAARVVVAAVNRLRR